MSTCNRINPDDSKITGYGMNIAIIGIAGKFPKAATIEEFWQNIRNGVDCISSFPEKRKKDIDDFIRFSEMNKDGEIEYSEGGYINAIDLFDYTFFNISPKEASLMAPSQRLFLETAWETIEDAGYGGKKLEGSKTGVYVGLRNISSNYTDFIEKTDPSLFAIAAPGNTDSIIPSRISYILDLRGPSILIDTACSSSLTAIHLACQGIINGDCDYAIAGGVEIALKPLKNKPKIGTESSDNRARTFDDSSEGTGESEGVAAILLKPLEKAIEDGDHVYAVIKSSAINQDGRSLGITAPNPKAQEEVIVRAWEKANIDPATISYIEAHGTGTKLGDPTEILGITRAFRRFTDKNQFCSIGSVKTNIGHAGGTAGIAGLIKSVMALKNKEIPPNIHFERPNRKISFHKSPVYINNCLSEWTQEDAPRRCGVSSFGFSGTNCHIVLEESPDLDNNNNDDDLIQILTLSAKSEDSLKRLLKNYKYKTAQETRANIRDICFTANTGRGHYKYRLALIIDSIKDLQLKLERINDLNLSQLAEEGIFYSQPAVRVDGEVKTTKHKKVESNEKLLEFIEKGQNSKEVLSEICALYISGVDIEWEKLYSGEKRKRVQLPTYSFEPKRCWIDIPIKEEDWLDNIDEFYSIIRWEQKVLHTETRTKKINCALVLSGECWLEDEVVHILNKEMEVIEVRIGEVFKKISDSKYIIQGTQDDYEKLFEDIKNKSLSHIIHLMTLSNDSESMNISELEDKKNIGVYSLFRLIKAIDNYEFNKLDLALISKNINLVRGDEQIRPEYAAMFGLGQVINWEYPNIKCKCIDIGDSLNEECIISELKANNADYYVAYRDGIRYIKTLAKPKEDEFIDNTKIKEDGVYIITGGLGDIGLEICKLLSSKNKVNLALINRSKIPNREEWDAIIKEGTNNKLVKRIETIKLIESNGSKVICISADVSKQQSISNAIRYLKHEYGNINGIVHAVAAVENGNTIRLQSEDDFKKNLDAKTTGTWIMNNLTKDNVLDFFVVFSSAITLIGGKGVGDYCAANSYLDSFAQYRSSLGKRTLSINWPAWSDMGLNKNVVIDESKELLNVLTPHKAIRIFDRLLSTKLSNAVAGRLNYGSRLFDMERNMSFRLSEELKQYLVKRKNNSERSTKPKKVIKKEIKLSGRVEKDYNEIERAIAKVWAEVLGYEEFNIHDNFFELGGDSIIAVKVESEMENNNIEIESSDIYKFPTIEALAQFIQTGSTKRTITENRKTPFKNNVGLVKNYNTVIESKNSKLLQNIQPYNDMFYQKNCFYNSLFPIVNHFGKNVMEFLVNDVSVYHNYKDERGEHGVKYLYNRSYEQLLKEMDINVKNIVYSENIIYDCIHAIQSDRPVIIWIDCYYISFREDAYLNKHIPHALLIYGYDKEQGLFNVIEHKSQDSLTYDKYSISFEDILHAYKGYMDNYQRDLQMISYYEFYRNGELLSNNITMRELCLTFCENMLNKKQQIFEGLEDLISTIEDIKTIICDSTILSKNTITLVDRLNSIINAKKIEEYKILNLFENKFIHIDILQTINSYWEFIRSKIFKFQYSLKYNKEDFDMATSKLNQIYQLEYKYNIVLLDFLSKVVQCKIKI